MMRLTSLVFALALMASGAAPAVADEHGGHSHGGHRGGEHGGPRGWRDGDIHHFRDHDFGRWRGGHWFHGRHDGRLGWWWTVGPDWYYYPRAIYPYPSPYVPPYAAPGARAWYFCPPLNNYYPYAAACPVPWQVVPQG